MSIDLEAIRERYEAATPGPWSIGENGRIEHPQGKYNDTVCDVVFDRDVDFIACARQDIPALLARVEGLEKERDAAMRDLEILSAYGCKVCGNMTPFCDSNPDK